MKLLGIKEFLSFWLWCACLSLVFRSNHPLEVLGGRMVMGSKEMGDEFVEGREHGPPALL